MRFTPGGPLTGCVIVACLALLAQCATLGATGLVWDDTIFLLRDPRLADLSTVFTAFAEPYFLPPNDVEMYRPVVNASFAIDWFVSGSAPGDPTVWWFRRVNLVLHAANSALAYLFLAHLTKRALGAPILAAALFAVHPLAVEPVAWIVGRCDLLATFFGLAMGILLLRSPGDKRALPLAVALFGLSLFAKATAALLPLVVVLGVVAYQGLPLFRLFGKRSLLRLSWFAVPAALWMWARIQVLGATFPEKGGLAWHDVDPWGAALGVGRGFALLTANVILPVNLCGDYAADPAWSADPRQLGGVAVLGLLLLLAMVALGAFAFSKHPRVAFPLLAFVLLLVPVLQVVPIGAIVADRFLYLPALFLYLLAGEGLERVFVGLRSAAAPAVTMGLFVVLGAVSHLRAPVWYDEIVFDRDVLAQYPGARGATNRLALALSETGAAADHAEAVGLLTDLATRVEEPAEEYYLLGTLRLETGDFEGAERDLLRAIELTRARRIAARARYNLAVVLKNTDRPDEARKRLHEALAVVPGMPEALALLETLEE